MASNTMYEEESESGSYNYPDSDEEDNHNQKNIVDFAESLSVSESVSESVTESVTESVIESSKKEKIKSKTRTMSIDSEMSDSTKANFKCGSCNKNFHLDKGQKMIRCIYCGYRILYKLRTRNYIWYKTE